MQIIRPLDASPRYWAKRGGGEPRLAGWWGGIPEETGDKGGRAAEPVFPRGKGHGVGMPTEE